MTRAGAALAAIAFAASGAALAFTWQPGLASLYDDSVPYLLMAQALAPFGHAGPPVLDSAPFDTYPPFFPLLLALTGGAFDWTLAHALVAASFGASVLLLGAYARRLTGSAPMGAAAALAYAFLPGAWLNMKGILSEFPYMALSFGILALHLRGRGLPLSYARTAALAVLLALLVLTRTIGIALVAAIAAAEAWQAWRARDARRATGAFAIAAVPAAVALLWMIARPSSGYDIYADFGGRAAQAVQAGGAEVAFGMLSRNASALVDAWLNALLIFWGEWWRPKFLLASGLALAALAAIAWRARRLEADALYVLAFLAILLVWPFPGQFFRLALPVFPLALVLALWGWQELLGRWRPGAAGRAAWAVVLPLALCIPPVLFYVAERARSGANGLAGEPVDTIAEFYRIPSGPAAAANAAAQLGVMADLRRVGETTPPDARVLWYEPQYLALLAGRRGSRLERPADSADLEAQVRRSGAGYIYLGELHPRDSARRLGHPLDPLPLAEPFTRTVWVRSGPGGETRGVLLEVDRGKIPKIQTPP